MIENIAQHAQSAVYSLFNSYGLTKIQTSYANVSVADDGVTLQAIEKEFHFNPLVVTVSLIALGLLSILMVRSCLKKVFNFKSVAPANESRQPKVSFEVKTKKSQ